MLVVVLGGRVTESLSWVLWMYWRMVEVEGRWYVRVPWWVVCVLICISCPPSLTSRRASRARCMFLSSVQSSRVESCRARGIYALAACVALSSCLGAC